MPVRPRLTPAIALSRKAIREVLVELAPKRILLAVSGGADSLALAAAAVFEAQKFKIEVVAAVVDHGLQKNSEEVAAKAKQTLNGLGIEKVFIERVNVATKGEGLEAAARDARYKALENVRKATKSDWIFLGHNQDDQAETVLIQLMRGAGLPGLSAMPPRGSDRGACGCKG